MVCLGSDTMISTIQAALTKIEKLQDRECVAVNVDLKTISPTFLLQKSEEIQKIETDLSLKFLTDDLPTIRRYLKKREQLAYLEEQIIDSSVH